MQEIKSSSLKKWTLGKKIEVLRKRMEIKEFQIQLVANNRDKEH